MCFNILTCQDEQGFVFRVYPNSVMYPLTEKQATHKASKQSSSYIGLRPPFGPFPMIDELKQALFFLGGSSYDNLWFAVSFPNLLLRKRIAPRSPPIEFAPTLYRVRPHTFLMNELICDEGTSEMCQMSRQRRPF